MKRPYNLPSLGDLACFEAAARHLSFKRAASELNVTPAAVSHRIKALEQELGQNLFLRNHRGVDLTETGALLFLTLQRSFESISDNIAQIRQRRDGAGVTIGATTAISGLWLTPRLSAFWKVHADIPVSQIVQDSEITGNSLDLSIHYGDPSVEKDETRLLFQDRILALGTERFAEKYAIRDVSDLQRAPLIHMRANNPSWTDWGEWFAAAGNPPPSGPSFNLNNYMISLRAAEEDVGAVLGWEGLIGNLLESGRLIQLVPDVLPSPWPFYLRIHAGASQASYLFADWLAQPVRKRVR